MIDDSIKFLENLLGGPLTFAELLKTIRETDDVTQVELAKSAGVSKGLVCDIEKGRRLANIEHATKFAKALGYPLETFVAIAVEDELRKNNLHLKVKLESA